MADTNFLQSINIGGKRFSVPACWEQLGLTKAYMLALLSRDEYVPYLDHKPTENDTLYTDPDSGNAAGFHAGQCVVYPDADVDDGRAISIAKDVTLNSEGVPTCVYWLHLTDIEKLLKRFDPDIVELKLQMIEEMEPIVSDLEKKSTTTDQTLESQQTRIDAITDAMTDTRDRLYDAERDIAVLNSGCSCYIAYWPTPEEEIFKAVPPDNWQKRTDPEALAFGVLVVPDMGEPFIVAPTEESKVWSKTQGVVFPEGASTELPDHFQSSLTAAQRFAGMMGAGGGFVNDPDYASTYCLDYRFVKDGQGVGPQAWYLPDLKTMMMMRKYVVQINRCLSAIDGAELLPEYGNGIAYWTSNEVDDSIALCFAPGETRIELSDKSNLNKVRPITYMYLNY